VIVSNRYDTISGDLAQNEEAEMKVKVVAHHRGEGVFPTFAKGTAVIMGDECTHFPHWYPCVIKEHETYIPESFVCDGRLVRDYNPTELVAEVGEVLEVQEIVYAWLFATNADGIAGWIPSMHCTGGEQDDCS